MKQTLRVVATLLAVLTVIGLAIAGAFWLVKAVGAFLLQVKSDVAIAITAAAIAGVTSVVSLALSKAYEARLALSEDIRARKTPIYEGIVKTVFHFLLGQKAGRAALTEQELAGWFQETIEKLTIWGSDDLIMAFGDFKNGLSIQTGVASLYHFEDLLLAIRRDLGHRDKKLARGSLLRLWVTDMDDLLKLSEIRDVGA